MNFEIGIKGMEEMIITQKQTWKLLHLAFGNNVRLFWLLWNAPPLPNRLPSLLWSPLVTKNSPCQTYRSLSYWRSTLGDCFDRCSKKAAALAFRSNQQKQLNTKPIIRGLIWSPSVLWRSWGRIRVIQGALSKRVSWAKVTGELSHQGVGPELEERATVAAIQSAKTGCSQGKRKSGMARMAKDWKEGVVVEGLAGSVGCTKNFPVCSRERSVTL